MLRGGVKLEFAVCVWCEQVAGESDRKIKSTVVNLPSFRFSWTERGGVGQYSTLVAECICVDLSTEGRFNGSGVESVLSTGCRCHHRSSWHEGVKCSPETSVQGLGCHESAIELDKVCTTDAQLIQTDVPLMATQLEIV